MLKKRLREKGVCLFIRTLICPIFYNVYYYYVFVKYCIDKYKTLKEFILLLYTHIQNFFLDS